ncbi:MAG: hypothetical protein H0W72_11635 [Planctomycetes bacterium]|nr:hypothetical protein [Planctomycetota bacterium]
MRLAALLMIALVAAAAEPVDPAAEVARRLETTFDRLLADPEAYQATVLQKCRGFPEGGLFPFTFPAIAYAVLAQGDRQRAPQRLASAALCLDRAMGVVARKVEAPGGDLARLADYRQHATYIGQLALALGVWRLAGGDDRYEAVHARLHSVLLDALVAARGDQLRSFPTYAWTFDTIPCLAALRLRDRVRGESTADAAIREHLAWVASEGVDAATELPASIVEPGKRAPPRGCDLSLRVAMLAQVDHGAARALWQRYVVVHWCERATMAGFREYPPGVNRPGDPDSGPILQGIGMSATGLGIAAARAIEDRAIATRLTGQLPAIATLHKLLVAADPGAARRTLGGAGNDPDYVTGFLFGDACMFFCVTWRDLGTALDASE